MMEFRIWVYNGVSFTPSEFFARASKLEHVEPMLNSKIRSLIVPCIIVISGLNGVLEN